MRNPFIPKSPVDFLERRIGKLETLVCLLGIALLGVLFACDWLRTDPLLFNENFRILPFYDAPTGRGLPGELAKLFDVCTLDDCLNRARPVGYLLEWLDAKLLFHANPSLGLGFRAWTPLPLVLGTVILIALAARNVFPRAPRSFLALLAMLYAVSGTALGMNINWGRGGKVLAAFGAAYCLWLWTRYRRLGGADRDWRAGDFMRAFGLLLLCLGDEQTVLSLALVSAAAAAEWRRSRRGGRFLTIAAGALVAYLGYSRWLGPALTHRIHPDMMVVTSYSNPSEFLFFGGHLFVRTLDVLRVHLLELVGSPAEAGPTYLFVGTLLIATGVLVARSGGRLKDEGGLCGDEVGAPGACILLAMVLGLVPLAYALACRHPPVVEEATSRLKYFMPSLALFHFCFVVLLGKTGAFSHPLSRLALALAFVSLGVGDFVGAPEGHERGRGGRMTEFVREDDLLRQALAGERAQEASMRLTTDARNFAAYYRAARVER